MGYMNHRGAKETIDRYMEANSELHKRLREARLKNELLEKRLEAIQCAPCACKAPLITKLLKALRC